MICGCALAVCCVSAAHSTPARYRRVQQQRGGGCASGADGGQCAAILWRGHRGEYAIRVGQRQRRGVFRYVLRAYVRTSVAGRWADTTADVHARTHRADEDSDSSSSGGGGKRGASQALPAPVLLPSAASMFGAGSGAWEQCTAAGSRAAAWVAGHMGAYVPHSATGSADLLGVCVCVVRVCPWPAPLDEDAGAPGSSSRQGGVFHNPYEAKRVDIHSKRKLVDGDRETIFKKIPGGRGGRGRGGRGGGRGGRGGGGGGGGKRGSYVRQLSLFWPSRARCSRCALRCLPAGRPAGGSSDVGWRRGRVSCEGCCCLSVGAPPQSPIASAS
jgi:hypothetical protein